MGLSWMAWTWPTAAFFGFIAFCLVSMTVWELIAPGGAPRRGILTLSTTRGDRLFISLLGTAYILLAWLVFMGRCWHCRCLLADRVPLRVNAPALIHEWSYSGDRSGNNVIARHGVRRYVFSRGCGTGGI